MLARVFLCTICVALVATPTMAKDKSGAKPEQVACAGVYGADSSEARVIETFGAENVVTGPVDGPEGSTYLATTVFPDDPERTMVFSWFDEDAKKDASSIRLSPSQTGPFGIRIGITVAEVEAINGEPFTLSGFWWDYGGSAGFDSGNLSGVEGDCYVNLRFTPPDEVSGAIDVTPISGDVEVPSSEGLLEVLDVRVEQVSLGYASEDYAY
ncbi:hypothetical protein SAMN05428969_1209 [Devosia sp. YR412]|uniref:hypothetical protein n=1 Tax=Devosia sp. YR412 TaxID=1881030 RepID=UPI0008C9BD06|nr:hypothetical protein [Devosia sp. YR412]SEP85519.1 hypothetical protein SAMN05428969_1209 [Devosia sp. YR412]